MESRGFAASALLAIAGTVLFSMAIVISVYFAPPAALQATAYGAGAGFVMNVGFQTAFNIDAGETG
jgi:hypothetical protein